MDDDPLNMSVRKFLKLVGVTSQRRIEDAVRAAVTDGRIAPGTRLDAAVRLTVPAVGLDVVIDGELDAGRP